jgi:hypothetical protein
MGRRVERELTGLGYHHLSDKELLSALERVVSVRACVWGAAEEAESMGSPFAADVLWGEHAAWCRLRDEMHGELLRREEEAACAA